MNFTEIFLRRPVLAVVISLLFVVLGGRAIFNLPINQYPESEKAVITVSTAYPGADAETIAGFITQPLESAIAEADGIDYLTSTSSSGVSTITANLQLDYEANSALTEISAKVGSVRNQLPAEAQQPELTIETGDTTDAMYLGFYSDTLDTNKVTDYLARVVKPQLDAIDGVQTAELLGARRFALRAWMDVDRLAGHGLSPADVSKALAANNYLAAVGKTKGRSVSIPLTADTDLHTVDDFKQLVVSEDGDSVVRLQDVAEVVLGADDYDFNVAFGGKRSVFVGIKVAPDANILSVAGRVKDEFPGIVSRLPGGLTGEIAYDSTEFIDSSIEEVAKTLGESLLIVTVVIFLFLGTIRAVAVPVIAMPLSLIGAVFAMQLLGFSINILTLLGLVLAIGLVVDDAIIVVENVERHMNEEGKSPFEAALVGARELGSPIIAMTIVLIAVYVPIAFQGGLTGSLFVEFAFTLAAAVTVSAVIALTLSPLMCARFFEPSMESGRFAQRIDRIFGAVRDRYMKILDSVLETWSVMIVMAVLLIGLLGVMFTLSQNELAPTEDQGIVIAQMTGPPTATADQMLAYSDQMLDVAKSADEYDTTFQITGQPTVNQGIQGVILKDYGERSRGAQEVQQTLQQKWNGIAGVKIAAFQLPALPGAQGLPVQFVITTTESFDQLNDVVQQVLEKARDSSRFYFLDSDLKLDQPQARLVIDRDQVAALGITQQALGGALGAALGGAYVNYFSIDGKSYKVIPQVRRQDRLNPSDLLDIYIETPNGVVPASTVVSIENDVVPESVQRFQQLNSATISGVPSGSQGDALQFLNDTLDQVVSSGYSTDYAGPSRQFTQESGGFLGTMLFAVVIVYLALAAQFGSFRDPIVILASVPLALFGAMIFIFLGFSTINIYTQVGLVTLMGLISKHGILIVEFANDERANGKSKLEAIRNASEIRLRPILMTTFAMVFGVLPLVIASGAGAAGRHAMGLVIFTGMAIGTFFTLFVVPSMYLFIAAKDRDPAEEPDESEDPDGGSPRRPWDPEGMVMTPRDRGPREVLTRPKRRDAIRPRGLPKPRGG